MSNTYSLFFDEAEFKLSNRTQESHLTEDELKKVVSQLISLEKQPSMDKERRAAAAMAHFNLKAAAVIRRAVVIDDDITITRWYQPEKFQNSGLLSDEEKHIADRALRRKDVLHMIRNKGRLPNEEDAALLQGSNLLLASERTLFSKILSSKIIKT